MISLKISPSYFPEGVFSWHFCGGVSARWGKFGWIPCENPGNFKKKGLPKRERHVIIPRVSDQRALSTLGCRQAVRHQTLTLAFVGSNPAIPAISDPLAQSAEQLPFKQWVRSSNLRRVTTRQGLEPMRSGPFPFPESVAYTQNTMEMFDFHGVFLSNTLSRLRFLLF